MNVSILTLFPEALQAYLDSSIIARARQAGLLRVELYNIRDYTMDKHRRVDDYPFGGGAGMVMTPQPIFDAVAAVQQRHGEGCLRVYMSPQGRVLDNRLARELSARQDIMILCGHYEGVDQRVLDECIDLEISIGDYVLTGGELPALVLLDCVSRFIPGVLGNDDAHADESFENGLLEYPQYTRPANFRGLEVPAVLLNGNHAHINRWRQAKSLEKTRDVRADLAEKHEDNQQS